MFFWGQNRANGPSDQEIFRKKGAIFRLKILLKNYTFKSVLTNVFDFKAVVNFLVVEINRNRLGRDIFNLKFIYNVG